MATSESLPGEQDGTEPQRSQRLVAPSIYWPRIIAEGGAIVVSILLAFALDAWWDGARAQQEELITLRGLRVDFAANAAELERVRGATLGLQAVADSILALTGPAGSSTTTDSGMQLLARLLKTSAPFRGVDGTLGALLASQGLSSISDPVLRDHLARWPQTTAPIRERAERIGIYFDERLMPYLQSRIPLRTMDAVGTPEFGARQSRFPLSLGALLSEVDFENLVNDFYYQQSAMLGSLTRAGAAADSIIHLIDQDPRLD